MRGCIVPGCRTGYKSAKIKCSAFKVPKNEVMRKKWEKAIPGIQTLKDTQCVCEKHFEPHCIIRKWEKRDVSGHIIASVVLQRPRLEENAIPTLFGDAALIFPSEKNTAINPNLTEDDSQDQSINVYHKDVINTYLIKQENNCQPEQSIDDESYSQIDGTIKEEYCDYIETNHLEKSNHEPQTTDNQYEHQSHAIDIDTIQIEHNYTDKCSLDSELIYSNPPCIASKFSKTTLPTSWSVKEKSIEGVTHLIFMFTIDRKINEIETPVIRRCVMINSQKADIRYFVHGIEIKNINYEILPNVLRNLSLLPEILMKFQRIRICHGCDDVDTRFISDLDAYQDVLNDWRHKQCTLLSENRKCEYCRKLRKIVLQRQTRAHVRLANGDKSKGMYNEIDQQNLSRMRTKLIVERHKKNRALSQIKQLHKNLTETQKKLAEISGKNTNGDLLKMKINVAKKLMLNKNTVAVKSSPQKHGYSQGLITLCKSINVDSPEVYELLKSNNIHLPYIKTNSKIF
ncbi:hypothetical protein PV328_010250 [Microctonus aethiopoides]|uniref:THAP-type domain-containing protein n=1 Tax=Microctonus aethiopoides TaxID=144406 RepID=A0AA39C8D9_9HYME|nr:hypothetical protein PV328_010250 [Microctonus aethiopoides]